MRTVSWVKAALKEFRSFPLRVQEQMTFALEVAAAGETADTAKPMRGFDVGVFEIAIPYRTDAFRAVYALKLGDEILGRARVSKEVDAGHQDPEARH